MDTKKTKPEGKNSLSVKRQKKMETMMMNSRFPAEVMMNILSHLPIKSLVRFRCVCKTLFRLLTGLDSDPIFTPLHAHQTSIANPNPILLLFKHPINNINSFYLAPDHTQFDNKIQKEAPEWWPYVSGVCNGLVCIRGSDDDAYLWNPITREHMKLPCVPWPSHNYKNNRVVYGFGFTKTTNEFKVIGVVITSLGSEASKYGHQVHVNVYTLSTNTWRTLQDVPFNVHPGHNSECGALVNGALHWIACEPEYKEHERLVSFNLENELFQEIVTPKGLTDDDDDRYHVHIEELRGELAIFRMRWKVKLDIWVMREYGVGDSWTKQFTITPSQIPEILPQYFFPKPFGVTGDGDILMRNSNRLVLLNPKTNSIRTTIIDGPVAVHTFEYETPRHPKTCVLKWSCFGTYSYKWSFVSPRYIAAAENINEDQKSG